MKVKDLISQLAKLDPNADVVGFCTSCKDDFHVHGADIVFVTDYGSGDGYHVEHGLAKYITQKVSACDMKPVGETVVVIH